MLPICQKNLSRHEDEIVISLRHLQTLSLFDQLPDPSYNSDAFVNATNREFMRACYPEIDRK
jgi:hypothetical protein